MWFVLFEFLLTDKWRWIMVPFCYHNFFWFVLFLWPYVIFGFQMPKEKKIELRHKFLDASILFKETVCLSGMPWTWALHLLNNNTWQCVMCHSAIVMDGTFIHFSFYFLFGCWWIGTKSSDLLCMPRLCPTEFHISGYIWGEIPLQICLSSSMPKMLSVLEKKNKTMIIIVSLHRSCHPLLHLVT